MPVSRFTRRHWAKLALVAALPVALYFFMAYRWSWRPRTLKIGSGRITSLAFVADSKTLAVSLSGITSGHVVGKDELQIWDIQNQTLLRHLQFTPGQVAGKIKVAPDGKTIAASLISDWLNNFDCALWEGHTLHWLNALNPEGTFIFTDNGHHLKICSDHYNTVEARERSIIPVVGQRPSLVTFDTRTAKILSQVRLILPRGYSYRRKFPLPGQQHWPVWTLSPDGRWGAVALFRVDPTTPGSTKPTGKVMLFDIGTGRSQHILLSGDSPAYDEVKSLAFSATGKNVVTDTLDFNNHHKMQLWDAQTGQLKTVLQEYPLAFSPNDMLWVSIPSTGILHLHDAQTNSVIRIIKDRHADTSLNSLTGWPVAFSPDGTTLATGGSDGTVKLWRIK